MLQLLKYEAVIYEGLKAKKKIPEIIGELGISKEMTYNALRRMVDYGALQRSGSKRHYTFTPVIQNYKVVNRRVIEEVETGDRLVDEAMKVQLTNDQIVFIMMNRKRMKRSELAKHLGLTKLQLNFALIKMES